MNDVKVYDISSGKTAPQWYEESTKKKAGSLRYNEGERKTCSASAPAARLLSVHWLAEFRRRIELIQDFTFPERATRVKMSRDGKYVAACGGLESRCRLQFSLRDSFI